jgi:hypothetical protein
VIEWLEHKFHPISTFFVVPVFAFANTGVVITSESIKGASQSLIAWGIFFGLVIGKAAGCSRGIAIGGQAPRRLADFPRRCNELLQFLPREVPLELVLPLQSSLQIWPSMMRKLKILQC